MLRDLFSNRLFLVVFVVFVIIIAASLFYDQSVQREIREVEEHTQRFLEQIRKKQIATEEEKKEPIETNIRLETQLPVEVEDISNHSNKPLETMSETVVDFPTDVPLHAESEASTDDIQDESEEGSAPADIEQTLQFVNSQFAEAAELYYEKFEIKSKSKPRQYKGLLVYTRSSPEDEVRLQEIQYEVYDTLTAISEMVPGAVEVKLSQFPSGFVGCEKYLFPHVFEEVFGQVPEGYYQFSEALEPFLNPPISQR